MVLGGTCTRGCRFCAVNHAASGEPVRPEEAEELAGAVAELKLAYVVITSVDRDDLPDRGASHFAACIRAVKARNPAARVEVLIPDYREGELELVLGAGPDVLAHNVETVARLQPYRDRRASYAASLHTLSLAAAAGNALAPAGVGDPEGDRARGTVVVKSSLMLGLGELPEEVLATMDDLRAAGCSSLVLGQYLRPTSAQVEVAEYVTPEAFDAYARAARERGFASVVASPLARTSYHARSSFEGTSARN
jgi:lipoic acid synthetase